MTCREYNQIRHNYFSYTTVIFHLLNKKSHCMLTNIKKLHLTSMKGNKNCQALALEVIKIENILGD